jgi:hypothetical protein
MQSKGFGDKLIDCLMRLVRGGKVAIKVNDQVSPLFQLLKVSVMEILYLFCA